MLSIPAVFGLLIASKEIVSSLFGYGSVFDSVDIIYTSEALVYFSIGVPALCFLIKVLSNFYFARDNTKTPFYISVITMFINIAISILLFKKYGFIIIPIATSISTWIGVIIYFYFLNQKNIINVDRKTLFNFLKILFSVVLMSFSFILV